MRRAALDQLGRDDALRPDVRVWIVRCSRSVAFKIFRKTTRRSALETQPGEPTTGFFSFGEIMAWRAWRGTALPARRCAIALSIGLCNERPLMAVAVKLSSLTDRVQS